MRPMIAVSLPARTVRAAARMMQRAVRLDADLVEIRLDYFRTEEPIDRIVKTGEVPLIATFRSGKNGSLRKTNEAERVKALISAAEVGFDYVDVELETKNLNSVVRRLSSTGAKTIASYHDFTRTASDVELRKVLQLCRSSGAALSKLVTMARRLEDNLRLLALTREASKNSSLICFGMGKFGFQSRIFSPIYGAAFTFASLDDEVAVAPGQISVSRMRRIYKAMGY